MLNGGASVREQFWTCLEKHNKTFNGFAESVEVKVDALISDRELLSAFFEYLGEAASTHLEGSLSVVLTPPKLDVHAARERAKQLLNLHKQVQLDISILEYARDLLKEVADFHERMMLKNIEFIREVYDGEIARVRPAIERKVDQLQKEMDAEIAKMNRIVENELKLREKEREKRERKLQELELQRADFVRRRDLRRRRNDKVGVACWEHRIRVCENRIREAKKRINDLTEFIEESRRQNEADIEKLRRSYQELIDQEKGRISSIEAERDEKIESKQKEMRARIIFGLFFLKEGCYWLS